MSMQFTFQLLSIYANISEPSILYLAESDSVAIVESWHSLPDSGSQSFSRDRLGTPKVESATVNIVAEV